MHLKILIREILFHVNLENWCRNTPPNSPKAPGTKSKFVKERVHRKELSKSVRFISVVLARQNSGKDHMRRPCNKKDAPAKQHGIWRDIFTSSRIRTKLRFSDSRSRSNFYFLSPRTMPRCDSGLPHDTQIKKNRTIRWQIFVSGRRSSKKIWWTEYCMHKHTVIRTQIRTILRKWQKSRKHCIYTHFPKDRNFEVCLRTNKIRAPCIRRTGETVPRAENVVTIMSFSMFSSSHSCDFLSDDLFRKQSAMSKRGQHATWTEGSPMAKARPCLVARDPRSDEISSQSFGSPVNPGNTDERKEVEIAAGNSMREEQLQTHSDEKKKTF